VAEGTVSCPLRHVSGMECKIMQLPGFSAEMALRKASRNYRSNYAPNAARRNAASLVPSQFADEAEAGDMEGLYDGTDDMSDDGDFGSLDDGESEGDDFE
jgi:hypothetical protein